MDEELNSTDLAQISAAKRYLKAWRYLRWVQVAVSLVLILMAFTFMIRYPERQLLFDIVHPAILAALGGVGLGVALADQKAKNCRLLVKMGKAYEKRRTSST